jgi:hypothetical protein
MTREMLPEFNESVFGKGLEGVVNYTNELTSNLLIPAFLISLYGLAIYVFSKSDYKLSTGIFFISFVFLLLSIVAQTFAKFSQMVIFIFFIGMIVGIVLYFIEGART